MSIEDVFAYSNESMRFIIIIKKTKIRPVKNFSDRKTGAELLTIRSTMDEKRPNTSQLVLKVWTKDCPEVFHFNQQSVSLMIGYKFEPY